MTGTRLPGAHWQISSYSGQNGNCVEVARNLSGIVAVRDSKDQHGPSLTVTPGAWRALLDDIRDGQLGL